MLKPTASIKEHCKHYCMNDAYGLSKCVTPDCHLRKKKSALKRIKDYCKECAADFKSWECTGEVLNTEYTEKHKCPLHPFRMGRNPQLKGKGNAKNLIPFQKRREEVADSNARINDN